MTAADLPTQAVAVPDVGTRVARTVALVAAWNQPFYPLYIYWAAGRAPWPAFLSLASTPFFAAVPWLLRRSPRSGKIVLVATGLVNTAACTIALGEDTLVGAYFVPILMLAAALFGRAERWTAIALALLGVAAALIAHALSGLAPSVFDAAQAASLAWMHIASAAALAGLIVFATWSAVRAAST